PCLRHPGEPEAHGADGHDVPARGRRAPQHGRLHGHPRGEELLLEERHREEHDAPHVHPRRRSARRGHPEPHHVPGLEGPFPPEVGANPRRRLHPNGREGIRVREATVRRADFRFRLGLNLRSIVGRAYPRVIGANREPSWLIFEVFLPLLGIAAYVFIYQAFYQAQAAAICPSPCTPTPAQLLALHQAGQNLNALVATVVLGGMMFASLYLLWGREAWNLSALMEEPIFFSSGMYFPAGGLFSIPTWGPAVAIAGSIVPATFGLDALRQLTLPGTAPLPLLPPVTELEILLVLAVVFLVLARYTLAYLETLAKREGKLTSWHQCARSGGPSRSRPGSAGRWTRTGPSRGSSSSTRLSSLSPRSSSSSSCTSSSPRSGTSGRNRCSTSCTSGTRSSSSSARHCSGRSR